MAGLRRKLLNALTMLAVACLAPLGASGADGSKVDGKWCATDGSRVLTFNNGKATTSRAPDVATYTVKEKNVTITDARGETRVFTLGDDGTMSGVMNAPMTFTKCD